MHGPKITFLFDSCPLCDMSYSSLHVTGRRLFDLSVFSCLLTTVNKLYYWFGNICPGNILSGKVTVLEMFCPADMLLEKQFVSLLDE